MGSRPRRHLSPIAKLRIRLDYLTSGDPMTVIAKRHGTTQSTVSRNTAGLTLRRDQLAAAQFDLLRRRWTKETKGLGELTDNEFLHLVLVLGGKTLVLKMLESECGPGEPTQGDQPSRVEAADRSVESCTATSQTCELRSEARG